MPNRVPKENFGARADAPANQPSDVNDQMRFDQMRDRLTALGDEARSIRSQIPSGLETDVERIQRQMQRLGERLAELGGGAYASGTEQTSNAFRDVNEPSEEEVICLGPPGQNESGWDAWAADALAQIYESGEAFYPGGALHAGSAPQAGSALQAGGALPMGGFRSVEKPPQAQVHGQAQGQVHSQGQRRDEPAPASARSDIPAARKLPVVRPQDEAGSRSGASPANVASASQVEDRAPGRVWLNERFADIARRIEQALAEIRPESSLLRLGQRFDQLEQRMTSFLSGVATRADLKELRVAEAQIEDIGGQLKQLRRQLTRLDSIDSHLGRLSEQLSDDRLGRLATARGDTERDEARLGAIESCLQTLSLQLSRDQLAEVVSQSMGGDLKGLIENLIHERRHNDENNASMLETMQQAIIRVLDRLDSLELAQQQRTPSAMSAMSAMVAMTAHELAQSAHQPTPPPMNQALQDEVERFTAELQRIEQEPAYEIPAGIFAEEEVPSPAAAPAPAAPAMEFPSASFDMDTAFARSPNELGAGYPPAEVPAAADGTRSGSLRHDFIADAHRAKLKAATKLAERSSERSSEVAAKLGTQPAQPRKRRSIFSLRSPRVLMGILILLAAIPAAIFFMPRTHSAAQDDDLSGSMLPVSVSGSVPGSLQGSTGHNMMGRDGGSITHDAPAAIEPAPQAPAGSPPADALPKKQSQQVAPSMFEDASQPTNIGYSHMDTASIAGGVQVLPVALALSHFGSDTDSAAPSDDKTINLPPAMVGPYSLRLAAAKGDPSAQFEVAVRLAEGLGTEPDLKQSFQWYQRSATSGFAMAQFRLGTLYERGLGVKTDIARAQVWYTRAAQQGNVKAIHNLAVLLAGRGGAKPDYTQAAKLFTDSAAYGLADSQYNLAMLYESGLGVPRDLKEAYKWLILAAKSGDKESQTRRDALKVQLSAADCADAEALAKHFRARLINPIANDFRAAGQAWRQNPNAFQRQG